MVAGTWLNQDGLYLQFGNQKAVPEIAGDYLIYGETREVESYIPLVPFQLTAGGQQVPAPPTAFSGTTTAAAAGIQSLTTLIPLQLTAPVTTTTGGVLLLSNPQLFFEQVEIETLVTAAGGTSVSIGLATINPTTQQFVQVTPNAGVQLIDTVVIANLTSNKKITWNSPGTTGISSGTAANNTIAGGGAWLGNVPLVTNAITPLPTAAYISTIATGTFTNGLLKFRLKYTVYGTINQ
jgi:hypothetical protein